MNNLFFSSKLDSKYRHDLERILFFNQNQKDYISKISGTLEKFGFPKLIENDGIVKIEIEDLPGTQNIFARDDDKEDANLLGVLIFYRLSVKDVVVLHLAVTEEVSSKGSFYDQYIVMRMINRLKAEVRKIRGIENIKIAYNGRFDNLFTIKVKKKEKV